MNALNLLRRYFLALALAFGSLFVLTVHAQNQDNLAFWNALKAPNAIVLFRHANAPGGGDPAEFRLNDCSTQRNLDAEGREQAQRIGQRFREQGIKVDAALTSQWCRTRETAQIAFPSLQQDAPAFNSFHYCPIKTHSKSSCESRVGSGSVERADLTKS
jgi:Histidine phosphatase superfamily (branch 1)